MQDSEILHHPLVEALDAALGAFAQMRETGTRQVSVDPAVWRAFVTLPPKDDPKVLPKVPEMASAGVSAEQRNLLMADLRQSIQTCQGCAYAQSQRFFGTGALHRPKVMVINGACSPTQSPVGQHSRLEGAAGELLWKMLGAIDLTPEMVYVTPVMKCPVATRPDNAALTTCTNFLRKEIQTLEPQAILLLGAVAAKGLFGGQGLASTGKVGQWFLYDGRIPVLALHHPARILMLDDALAKPLKSENWSSLVALKKRLEEA